MRAFLAAPAFLLAFSLTAAAQPPEQHTHKAGDSHGDRLGDVAFENSGAPQAQEPFQRGLALLHSFEYGDAAEAFRAAQQADPGFAMAYWGEALTYSHLLWGQEDLAAARAALARLAPNADARLARAGSPRERAYGAAVEAFFAETDLVQRVRAFADAMRRIAADYPDDVDAQAFAALAVMFLQYDGDLPAEQTGAARDEAIMFAERAYALSATHPGAVHYLIHATDDPAFAARGEAAARSYAAIAPDAEHALHMPSHIFLQLGLWDDVVASNERAWAASRADAAARGASSAEVSFHALQWLHYGYLQQGRFRDARALADTARALLRGVDLTGYVDARFAVSELEFVYGENTRDWSARVCASVGAPDTREPASAREESFRIYALMHSAFAELHCRGEEGEAGRALRSAAASADAARVVKTAATMLDALSAQRRGDHARAAALLQPLADAPAEPLVGPPLLPRVHELYAESLLALGRAAEAAAVYERALQLTPNRAAALTGLARARAAAGDNAAAAAAYRRLLDNWHHADPDLAILAEARKAAAGG